MCVAISAALDQEDREEKGWVTHAQVCRILRHVQVEFSISPKAMKRVYEALEEHKRLLAPGKHERVQFDYATNSRNETVMICAVLQATLGRKVWVNIYV